jgi:hypothetical protein
MIFHQEAAAATQPVVQIRAEIRLELRAGEGAGARQRRPGTRPHGLKGASVHAFAVDLPERSLETVF